MNRIFILVVCLIIILARPISAKMVRYVDENGKPHYVNSDFVKIPERYLPQVKSQLEPPTNKIQKNKTGDAPGITEQTASGTDAQNELPSAANAYFQPPTAEASQETTPNNNSGTSSPRAPLEHHQRRLRVDLFTSKDCSDCKKLEQTLISENIPYEKYEINRSSYAKRVYQNTGGELPIVRIGSQTFHATSTDPIKQILYPKTQ